MKTIKNLFIVTLALCGVVTHTQSVEARVIHIPHEIIKRDAGFNLEVPEDKLNRAHLTIIEPEDLKDAYEREQEGTIDLSEYMGGNDVTKEDVITEDSIIGGGYQDSMIVQTLINIIREQQHYISELLAYIEQQEDITYTETNGHLNTQFDIEELDVKELPDQRIPKEMQRNPNYFG